MNTIPSIFNERQINHTILGGPERAPKVTFPIACLVLNRTANPCRARIIENLLQHGFSEIIFVELGKTAFTIDESPALYPFVKFLLPQEEVTTGDMLNLGMATAQSPYVLVLPDDMCMSPFQFSLPLAERIMKMEQFCVCPRLFTSGFQMLPVIFSPSVEGSVFTVESTHSVAEGRDTLYASDWAGLYDREKFMRLGGADYTIASEYWQKLDLFFRAWLWGECTSVDVSLSLSYSSALPEENRTVDFSYLKFYLKNLVPAYITDHAEIRFSALFALIARHSCSVGEALRLFNAAKKWAQKNKYRFKKDATALIECWGKH